MYLKWPIRNLQGQNEFTLYIAHENIVRLKLNQHRHGKQ